MLDALVSVFGVAVAVVIFSRFIIPVSCNLDRLWYRRFMWVTHSY